MTLQVKLSLYKRKKNDWIQLNFASVVWTTLTVVLTEFNTENSELISTQFLRN